MIFHFSSGIARLPGLETLLGDTCTRYWPWSRVQRSDLFVGWGRKTSAMQGQKAARRHGLPFVCLEDGFLRSVGLGNQDPPLSIVQDRSGIYFDAGGPSDLETLISAQVLDVLQQERCRLLIAAWQRERVSKYNHQRDFSAVLPDHYVLAVDQTFGDASIHCGFADAASFHRMLAAALDENPECTVLLKIHPDVFSGKKKGHFDPAALRNNPRVQVLTEDVHPASLLEKAGAVYVVTSQMGFEGLLWGKPVHVFGMPFYAGWGLTRDALSPPSRRRPVALENLVHAALIDYPRYLDPETGKNATPERVLEWLGMQRRQRQRFPAQLHAVDFSGWKRPVLEAFFGGSHINYVAKAADAPPEATLVAWGMRDEDCDARLRIRVEDGFLRSVGLGVDLVRPVSWIIDRQGIYYNATCASDLEGLLAKTDFSTALLERAAALRQRISTAGLTKYNVGSGAWQRPADTNKVILVPGQVETDASLAFGAPGICRNLDLLKAVREANPHAYVIYKPHPDVVAGMRKRGENEDSASHYCDEVVVDLPMGQLLNQVDEVHVLTSLAGFEALLRGKHVATYGQPFYAGWGLTRDHCPPQRRQRKLSLDALVAGALILYPTYVSRSTGRFTTPEGALDELLAWRAAPPAGGLFMNLKRRILRLVVGVR
jgi:capsular polysaccharide export protein